MENVKVVKGGPYVVTGDFKLNMLSGEVKDVTGKTYLCRCGYSSNKPFCDGAHVKSDFDK